MLQQAGFVPKTEPPANTPEPPQGPATPHDLSHLSTRALEKIGAGIVALATITGIGFWQLRPKVLIEPYASLNPHNPFTQQFSIENQSLYTISELSPRCELNLVEAEHATWKDVGVKDVKDAATSLDSGTKTTGTCALDKFFAEFGAYKRLEITFWVSYKDPVFGSKHCKSATFKGKPSAAGDFLWTYDGARECFAWAN